MELRVRTLGGRSAFAKAIADKGAEVLRQHLDELDQVVNEELEAELRSRGVNFGRADSGSRSGVRLAGSFRTKTEATGGGFPIRTEITSDAPHAYILNKFGGVHEIRPRNAKVLVIPASRNKTGKTMVRKRVMWSNSKGLTGYVRVGSERAVRRFLSRFR